MLELSALTALRNFDLTDVRGVVKDGRNVARRLIHRIDVVNTRCLFMASMMCWRKALLRSAIVWVLRS